MNGFLSLSHPCISLKSPALSQIIPFIFPVYASFARMKALVWLVHESRKLLNGFLPLMNGFIGAGQDIA